MVCEWHQNGWMDGWGAFVNCHYIRIGVGSALIKTGRGATCVYAGMGKRVVMMRGRDVFSSAGEEGRR